MHAVPTMVTATLLLGLVRRQHAGPHTWDDQFLTNYSPQTTLSTAPLPGTIRRTAGWLAQGSRVLGDWVLGKRTFLTCSEIYKLKYKFEIRSAPRQNTNPEMIHKFFPNNGSGCLYMSRMTQRAAWPQGSHRWGGEHESEASTLFGRFQDFFQFSTSCLMLKWLFWNHFRNPVIVGILEKSQTTQQMW